VNVAVMSRRARNMIPAGLFTGAHVRRRFLRREEAHEGIPCAEGVRWYDRADRYCGGFVGS
jgi:hypothetical protein